jgi:thioredoxin reductase (NADPH)
MDRYDIVIVGGGMAGLSAAVYGGWLGRSVLLLEREVIGGQIINAERIENFPGFSESVSGAEIITRTRAQAINFGAKTFYQEATGIESLNPGWSIRTEAERHPARTVIIASGGKRRPLGIPGEAQFEGRGISHCASCDGAFFAGKPVCVIGGGDTALDEALLLAGLASHVTLIHRNIALDASPTLVERVLANSKLDFRYDSIVEEVMGHNSVEAVRLRNLKTQSASDLPVAGVFICVGFEADTGFAQGLVDTDSQGHIVVDLMMKTSAAGIFAAGYARQNTAGQLASAAGDGVTAAVAAHRYIDSLGPEEFPS